MAASIIDSAHLPGHLQHDAMRQVWSDENRTAKYMQIERALAIVQARLGLIPQEACRRDRQPLPRSTRSTWTALRQQTERIGYPILGVVTQINQLCRDKLGEYVHWGATTQDITDTATVLQIREALDLVEADLAALATGLATLAREHR
jgi:3-carboxy-cis,cis-muconate cycloisomerase